VTAARAGTAGDATPAAASAPDSLAPEVERFAALRGAALASAEQYGTPQYLLDVRTLRARADALKAGMQGLGQPAAVLYAYKANYLLRVVRELTARVAAEIVLTASLMAPNCSRLDASRENSCTMRMPDTFSWR